MNKEGQVHISGVLLARNTILNFIGQVVPLLVGVATIPFIVRGLGTERFGLLSLAWMILGYFAIFDLGLGRATTKFVAEALGKGEEDEVPRIVWTAVTVQAILGVLGALVLISITPLLVEHILNIPPELVGEAKAMFYILALSVPVVLVSASFRGVLEAAQRFDLVNAVKIPISSLTFLLPLIGLLLGLRLPGIVALILLARLGALVAFIAVNLRMRPQLRRYAVSFSTFHRLFSFGGWVTVSNLVIPIFVYLDRFLIGALLTISAVAYYAAPYEVVTRLLIIPAAMTSVLFPTFSSLAACDCRDKLNDSVMRSIKYLVIVMIPLTLIVLIFAEDILRVWLGNDFSRESTNVFQLLSIAVLLNAIGYIPFALIQGIGRPDIIAKYHLVELPVYMSVAFFLINYLGINGAALAWCLRMVWTIPIFFVICARVAGVPLKALSKNGTDRSLIIAAVVLIPGMALSLVRELGITAIGLLAGALLIGYMLLVWFIAFDRTDKYFAKSLILQARNFITRGS